MKHLHSPHLVFSGCCAQPSISPADCHFHRITIHFEEEDGTYTAWNITPDGICSNSQYVGNYVWENSEYQTIADLYWDGLYYKKVWLDYDVLSKDAIFLPEETIAPLLELFRSMELEPTSNEPDYSTKINVMLELGLAGDQPVSLFSINEKGEVVLHVNSKGEQYYTCKNGQDVYAYLIQLEEIYGSYPAGKMNP